MDLDFLTNPPHWQESALCAETDPALFFPEKGVNPAPAKSVCARCTVTVECGLIGADQLFGVWGGLSQNDRKKLRNRAKRRAA